MAQHYMGETDYGRQRLRQDLALLDIPTDRRTEGGDTMARIGRWVQVKGNFTTPGGTPYYVCGGCGQSGHLNGCEYPKRKVICDGCGRINIYPWERAYEEGSSLWVDDGEVLIDG
jgi:hypothetical protein